MMNGIIKTVDANDRARYLRQTIFAPLGEAGQEKLLAARVLILGCGATGSTIANTLARAGVGHLKIADRDFIELNNLQRQLLFDEADIAAGLPKAVAAARSLSKINSSITVEPIVADVNAENIEDLMADADLLLDGTDNFETRYLINDACVKHNRPWIYGGAVGSYGATMTIIPRVTACFRCVHRHTPPPGTLATCDTAGVIAPIVTVIASIVSAEAIKLLSGSGTRNQGMIHIDLWENTFETFQVARHPDCPTCVHEEYDFLEGAGSGVMTAFLCGRNAVQVRAGRGHSLNLRELAGRLSKVGPAMFNEYLVHFSIDNYRMTIFPDARAIVQGTDDETVAKNLYAKYVGM
jgi:molybdopterin/thiamine biosynthesis adenylyltransferase